MTKKQNLGGRRVRCADGVVRTMVDATYVLAVTIIQADWEGAVCSDPSRCVMARAVMRFETANGRPDSTVAIGADKAYLIRGDTVIRFQVPPNEAALLRTFDQAAIFPVGYTMRLVPVKPAERLGARSKSRGVKDRTQPPKRETPRERRLPTRTLQAPRCVQEEVST